ncbi:MAG: SRPBCC family protein [Candidatus Limnocylindria bacterium]
MATATALKVTTPSDIEIQLTREFNAPRDLIFRAFTDPKHIPQYWGRRKDTTTVDVMDVRPGGKWRFLTKADDGDHAFRGEFREIVPPEKIVWTFEWEGLPGHISTETWILEDIGGGRTRMVATSRFDSKEDRDGMLQSGMESGARELYDRLEELLDLLKAKAR